MRLSRSEQKRRIKEVEQLVRELVALPEHVVQRVPCDREIRLLLTETQALKGGARKRQIKYITKSISKGLATKSLADLYNFLTERKGRELRDKKQFHELEYLRDSLLNEAIAKRKQAAAAQQELSEIWESVTIGEIKKALPMVDTIALGRLAAIYARTRQSRHSREIFRLLRAARELENQREKENH